MTTEDLLKKIADDCDRRQRAEEDTESLRVNPADDLLPAFRYRVRQGRRGGRFVEMFQSDSRLAVRET